MLNSLQKWRNYFEIRFYGFGFNRYLLLPISFVALCSDTLCSANTLCSTAEKRVIGVFCHIGLFQVPRAYVMLASGSQVSGQELAAWANARLAWQHR